MPARQTADRRKNNQPQNVVNHRRGENDLAGNFMKQTASGKDGGGNTDAGGHQRSADENGFRLWRAPSEQDPPTGKKRHDDADGGDQA